MPLRARWPARLWVALMVLVGAVGGLAAPASAHATLQSTSPPSDGSVTASPGEVVLHFDQQVVFRFDSVEVYDANSKRVDSGGARHPAGDSRAVEVAVPRVLPKGGYVVTWRVVSADSHPVHGAFTFFIGGATGGLGGEAARLLARSSGSRAVGVAFGAVRFAAFAAAAVFLGGALFALAIWPGARDDRRARRLIWAGFVILVVASAAAFALQGPYGDGLGMGQALKGSVVSGVWHTQFGHVYAARLVLLAAAGLLAARLLRVPAGAALPAWLVVAGGLVGVAILSTWGLADHARTGSLVVLAVPFDVIHLGAAAVWVGGLAMILVAVLPASRGNLAGQDGPVPTALPRFSQWALGAVVLIALTGLFAAWRQIGLSRGALTATPYGKLVIYKTAGFAVLMVLASASRNAVHGHLALPFAASRRRPVRRRAPILPRLSKTGGPTPPTTRLARAVAAEVAVALAVLGFTAVLVNAEPAKQAYAAPFSTEVKAGPDLVNAVVDPAKAGPLTIHMYILSAEGAVVSVPQVTATMTNAAANINGLTVPLIRGGPGHFLTSGFVVPIRGTWVLQVTVRTTDIDEYNAEPITVNLR